MSEKTINFGNKKKKKRLLQQQKAIKYRRHRLQ